MGTFAYGINNAGQIVGSYVDATGTHGFLFSDGTFTTIDDPLATQGTFALGINNAGEIVGLYVDAAGDHGFLDIGGTLTTIYPLGTQGVTGGATGINDSGEIVGFATIPEPSTLAMNLAVLLGMGRRMGRKRLTGSIGKVHSS